MKLGTFQQHIITLLMLLAIFGAGFANAWDFSDFHDGHILHIDHAIPHYTDMDNVKHKQRILPTIITSLYVFAAPEPVVVFHGPTPVQIIRPQSYITQSIPSRASPA
jgi:hypothetical protein